MSCLNPLLMIKYDFSFQDRKVFLFNAQNFRDRKYLVDTKKQFIYKIVSKESRKLPLDKILDEYALEGCSSEILELPCKKCIGCRLDYSKDWANRCSLEAQKYKQNYFITLTYDDEFAPIGDIGNQTLKKSDLDDFIKKVRSYFWNRYKFSGIKIFGCGEYGSSTWRPHYHILMFNLPLLDLTDSFPSSKDGCFIKKLDSMGVPMLFSPLISSIWNKGIITIQEFSWNAGAYVSKYILKKQTGEGGIIYDKLGVIPPFLRMSNGIGRDFLENNKSQLLNNPCLMVGRDHKTPLVSGLPHYFKKVLKAEYPDEYDSIIESSKEFMNHQRSCVRSHQSLNFNRSVKEARLIANSNLSRDLKEKA